MVLLKANRHKDMRPPSGIFEKFEAVLGIETGLGPSHLEHHQDRIRQVQNELMGMDTMVSIDILDSSVIIQEL